MTGDTDSPVPLPDLQNVQADVHIDAETWEGIGEHADQMVRHDPSKDAETAFWDAVNQAVETSPTIIVDGDVKGPADIPSVDAENVPTDDTPDGVLMEARAEYRADHRIPLHVTVDAPETVLEDAGSWDELTESVRVSRADD